MASSQVSRELHNLLEMTNEELRSTLEELTTREEELHDRHLQLEAEQLRYQDLFNFAPDGYLVTDTSGKILEANQAILELLSNSREVLLGKPFIVFIDPKHFDRFYTNLNYLLSQPERKKIWELLLLPKQRNPFTAEVSVSQNLNPINNQLQLHWFVRDISDRKATKEILEIQTTILERIARGEPLSDILATLLESMELLLGNALCSVLLCDRQGKLHNGIAPSLPEIYLQAIEGMTIGEGCGSCGTAVFRRELVIATDIATDPLWQNYRDLALAHNLKACWSIPIIGSDNLVLGTFATYYREIRSPQKQEVENALRAANIVGIAIELDQTKQAKERQIEERSLKLGEERFRQAFDNTAVSMCLSSVEGKILKVNAAFCDLLGYSEAELLKMTFYDLTHSEDVEVSLENIRQVQIEQINSYQIEKRYFTKHQQIVWVLVSVSVNRDIQDTYLIIQIQDISDRKQSEILLQQQARREHLINAIGQRIRATLNLQDVLNTTVTDIHQVLQADRVMVYQVLSDGTGKTIAESVSPEFPVILGMNFAEEIFSPQNYIQGSTFALEDRETAAIPLYLANFLRELQVRAQLVVPIIQNNSLWGLLIAHQCYAPRHWQSWEIDILQQLSVQLAIAIQQSELYAQLNQSHSHLSHSNTELIRATRLKDEFLANMSHELRTPLNAILGMSEGLLEDIWGSLNDPQKNAIATIESSGKHLLGLINDILELSKIEAGKLDLDITKVAIAPLCQSSLTFVKQQAFKKQIRLNTSLSADLGEIAVDERRIRQVLINLLTNAVKFTPAGGQVNLEVDYEPLEANFLERIALTGLLYPQSEVCPLENRLYLCISVIDTGIGIALADQDKLFQPFVQIDSSLNRQYEGTGLGLALVKQIVELHGGDVSLKSQLGEGSRFTIRLPYVCKNADIPPFPDRIQISEAIATPESMLNQPLILLAEDNEANISTFSSYLEAKGYRILVALNGKEAIALAKAHQPDLILMDVQMPIMDGLEATKQIRLDPNFANIPIIALTALAMTGDRDRCLESGANQYLTKPVKLKQLDQSIQQFLITTKKDNL